MNKSDKIREIITHLKSTSDNISDDSSNCCVFFIDEKDEQFGFLGIPSDKEVEISFRHNLCGNQHLEHVPYMEYVGTFDNHAWFKTVVLEAGTVKQESRLYNILENVDGLPLRRALNYLTGKENKSSIENTFMLLILSLPDEYLQYDIALDLHDENIRTDGETAFCCDIFKSWVVE